MKKILFLMMLMSLAIGMAFAQSITMTNSGSGNDSGPTVVSITSTGAPAGSTITSAVITSYMGSYIPSWYNMHLTIGGTTYNNVGNLTNAVYSDINGQSANGQVVTITSVDNDAYSDYVTMTLTVVLNYQLAAGYPGNPTSPSPASGSLNVPTSGSVTWTFGADTSSYDLWFGPTGSMTRVVTGAGTTSGATGSYTYAGLTNDAPYSWQVVCYNTTARLTTNGPVWNFRSALAAGIIQIGTGTTTSLLLPIYTYYGYTYSQSIFLQSEVNVPDQRIEKIWYYWNGATAASTVSNDWVVYIGHTANTAFTTGTDWIPLISLQQCFAGNIDMPIAAGWIEITLSTPFIYNNTDNLVVCVEENEPGYDSPYGYFQGTTSATNRSIRFYSDGTNPDPAAPPTGTVVAGYPNIRMQFGDLPVGAPEAPVLTYPANGTLGLPKAGFNLAWTAAATGGAPDYYAVYMSMDEETIYGDVYFETTGNSLNPTTYADGPSSPITFGFGERWYWTVEAINGDGSAVVEPAQWFEIQTDPTISTFPYTESFDNVTFPPNGWVSTPTVNNYPWKRVTAGTYPVCTTYSGAGMLEFDSYSGTTGTKSELATPPINLPGDGYQVSLMMYGDPGYPSSDDLVNVYYNPTANTAAGGTLIGTAHRYNAVAAWYPYSFMLPTGSAGDGRYVVFEGVSAYGNDVYVDDIKFELPLDWDVTPISIDMPEVVEAVSMIPKATVKNVGLNEATFNVRMDIGTWNNTQSVTVASGAAQQVLFASYLPTVNTGENVTVTTLLGTDENTTNDIFYGALICLNLDVQAYADCAYDPTAALAGPVTFNLQTPGTITDLNPVTPWSGFLTAGDWMNGKWMGIDQTTYNWWDVNPADGTAVDMGDVTMVMTGVTLNTDTNVIYATNGTSLYTLSATGVPTLVGLMNTVWTSLGIVDIAYDSWNHKLFGACVTYNALFEIDMTTAAVTPATYYLGPDINYTQGMAFDHTNGNMYLAGYTSTGALYWIDTVNGLAYKVGDFQSGSELDGFAIPFGGMEIPDVVIGTDGTISWVATEGATGYNVYSSADPYGTYTFETSTTLTSWLDPAFSEGMKFYVVTASDAVVTRSAGMNRTNLQPRGKVVDISLPRTAGYPAQIPPVK